MYFEPFFCLNEVFFKPLESFNTNRWTIKNILFKVMGGIDDISGGVIAIIDGAGFEFWP